VNAVEATIPITTRRRYSIDFADVF